MPQATGSWSGRGPRHGRRWRRIERPGRYWRVGVRVEERVDRQRCAGIHKFRVSASGPGRTAEGTARHCQPCARAYEARKVIGMLASRPKSDPATG
jgi:hypothetical protein